MTSRTTCLTALLAFAVAGIAACGGGDTDGGQMKAEGQAAGQMEDTATEAEQAGAMVEVMLSPKNQSGIAGSATLRHRADTLRVSLRLTGLEGGNSYPAHIHQGTCQKGGGVAAGLTSVTAQDSTGTSETRIPASKLTMDGSYFVQAHLPDGTPAACGDLPGRGGGASGGASSGSSGSGGA